MSAAAGGDGPAAVTVAAGAGHAGDRSYRVVVPAAVEVTLAALRGEVEAWGGEWTAGNGGGEVGLPVQAGLRFGRLRATARVQSASGGCEIVLAVHDEQWALDRSSVALLALAAVGGLATVLWPFFPPLGRLVPMGLVFGITAWLAILSRLRHHGPAELLAAVRDELGAQPEGPAPAIVPQ